MLRDPRCALAGGQLRRPVARHAQGADLAAGSEHLSRVRREPAPRLHAAKRRMFVEQPGARRSQHRRPRSARTTRSSTSGSREHYGLPGVIGERFRKVTFSDGVRGGTPRPGRRADGDVLSRSHGAGGPRLLGAREPARHAAAAAAAERARSARPRPRTAGRCRCGRRWRRTAGTPPARSATCGWIRWASRWRTSTRSAAGARSAAACPWTRRRCSRTARRSTASPGLRALHPAAPRTATCTRSSSKLLTYALGRHVDYRDQPAIRAHHPRRRGRRTIAGRP